MRWSSFFILAYVALGLQLGLARAIEWRGASPDFVLLGVIFLCLNARRDSAMLGCFMLGLLRDLAGNGTLGLYALGYGIVAMVVAGLAQGVNRRHPLAHFLLTLFGGGVVAIVLTLHEWIRPVKAEGPLSMGAMFYSVIYSAILAPLALALLQRIGGVFRFQRNLRG